MQNPRFDSHWGQLGWLPMAQHLPWTKRSISWLMVDPTAQAQPEGCSLDPHHISLSDERVCQPEVMTKIRRLFSRGPHHLQHANRNAKRLSHQTGEKLESRTSPFDIIIHNGPLLAHHTHLRGIGGGGPPFGRGARSRLLHHSVDLLEGEAFGLQQVSICVEHGSARMTGSNVPRAPGSRHRQRRRCTACPRSRTRAISGRLGPRRPCMG